MRDRRRTTRRGFLGTVAAGTAAATAGCLASLTGDAGSGGGGSMTIFHAGSLAPPFAAAQSGFEDEHDADVTREAKGSVASTQKITEQGRSADVLGVSDFRLIRDRLLPEYGDWYAIFTTNAMAISYTADSKGAADISTDNWWEVLTRDGVTIGHSDPAVDPGGYRAVMMQQLGAEPFEGEALYDQSTYEQLRENSTVPTGTEINLREQVRSGKLDYAIYYQSIAKTTEGLEWVSPQPQVDLSRATSTYAKHYAKATVETSSGTFTGAPIAYGIAVPGVAENPDLGAKWVEYMITDPGKAVLREKGLKPVDSAVVPASGKDAVPDRVLRHATAQDALGPLEL